MERSTRLLPRLSAVLLSALVLQACQHKPLTPKGLTLQEHVAQGQALYEKHIGKLTFDRAIKNWGQPQSVVEGQEITSVLWKTITDPGGTIVAPVPMPKSLYYPDSYYAPTYLNRPSHGEQLDCTFDKATGLLQTIRYLAW